MHAHCFFQLQLPDRAQILRSQCHPWLSNAVLIKGWAGGLSCESE